MQCKRGENPETIRKMMSSQLASKLARVWLPGSAQANRTFLLKLFVRHVPLCRMIFHTVESVFIFFLFVSASTVFAFPLFESQACFFWAAFHRSACLFYLAGCGGCGGAQRGKSPRKEEPKHRFRRSRRPPRAGTHRSVDKKSGRRAQGDERAGKLFGFSRKNR